MWLAASRSTTHLHGMARHSPHRRHISPIDSRRPSPTLDLLIFGVFVCLFVCFVVAAVWRNQQAPAGPEEEEQPQRCEQPQRPQRPQLQRQHGQCRLQQQQQPGQLQNPVITRVPHSCVFLKPISKGVSALALRVSFRANSNVLSANCLFWPPVNLCQSDLRGRLCLSRLRRKVNPFQTKLTDPSQRLIGFKVNRIQFSVKHSFDCLIVID